MAKYPLSRPKLHRALLRALRSPSVTVTTGTFRDHAGEIILDEYLPGLDLKIKIDANGRDPVDLVIHELLHAVFARAFVGFFDDTLEEVCVEALTSYMMTYVHAKPTRYQTWAKLVREKIEAGLTDVPFEEQVKR